MVQRLNSTQTRRVIADLIPQGLVSYGIPDPMSAERMLEVCGNIAAGDAGRCYGWFDSSLVPHGVLVGMVMPDPMTGVKSGYEHVWWTAHEWRGKPALELMDQFSADCKAEGCKRITFGFTHHSGNPRAMQRFYRRRGFSEYNTSMSKAL